MSCWLAWPPSPSSLGPFRRSPLGADPAASSGLRPAGDAVGSLDHDGQLLFHHHQGRDDFPDALAGEILEIAGFINPHDMILHVLRETMVVVIGQRGDERARAIIDGFDRRQDLLCRRFHALDRGRRVRRPRAPSGGPCRH